MNYTINVPKENDFFSKSSFSTYKTDEYKLSHLQIIGIERMLNNWLNHGLTIETNIFDFDEEAYGKPLTLAWYKFIRKNKKFSGIEELSHQLDQDKRDIKQYFYKLKN